MLNPRIVLHRPASADLTELALLHPDAASVAERWTTAWDVDGLAPWVVRASEHGPLLGTGGVLLRDGRWSLGWRFIDAVLPPAASTEYAVQLARRAIAAARRLRPDVPIVLLAGSAAEAAVAERLGLIRTAAEVDLYADRPLRAAA